MQKEQPEEIKLLLLGESSVGKTSIFNRYIYDKMDKNISSSIGVDFETKIIKYRNKKYKIRLFDTAGQERFQSITRSYYHLGDGFLIVFDLTNEHSLNMIQNWIESLQENVNLESVIKISFFILSSSSVILILLFISNAFSFRT